jgi:DNA replication protein DnaC
VTSNTETAWAAIVAESTRRLGSTTTSAPSCRRTLRLHPEARAFFQTNKPRRAALVPPALREAISAAAEGRAEWPLFITGPAGTGKTCAALVLLDHAGGLYFTAAGLCEELIRAQQGRLFGRQSGHPIWPEQLWAELGRTALVVLDEIGSREKVSDFAYETVKRVLDVREGLPLVAISNLDLATVAQVYDDRVVSRLAAGTVLRLQGQDRRLRG